MADKLLKLDIVTPVRVVFSGEVASFSAPGVMGSFQVLWNHAPMIAEISIGEAKLLQGDGNEIRFATSGGYVEVLDNHITMIAETAERSDEIDQGRARAAGEKAREKLTGKILQSEIEEIKAAAERARNRIRVAKKG